MRERRDDLHGGAHNVKTPEIWNPLPGFTDVHQDRQLGDIVPMTQFFPDAYHGRLPAVSWVIPSGDDSEHPPARVSDGQDHVVRVINAIMSGPDWKSTAIFLAWDDWAGSTTTSSRRRSTPPAMASASPDS